MDHMMEASLLGQKLYNDISLDSNSDISQGTNYGGNYDTTPKSSKFWHTPTYSSASASLVSPATSDLASPFSRHDSFSRKTSMNPHAPSYVPTTSSTSGNLLQESYQSDIGGFTYPPQKPQSQNRVPSATQQLQQQMQPQTPFQQQFELYSNRQNNYNKGSSNDITITNESHSMGQVSKTERDLKLHLESLQSDLILKNQLIENLTEQIVSTSDKSLDNGDIEGEKSVKIPSNYLELFTTLNKHLNDKTKELEETKNRLEAIITAISLNPQRSRTFYGDYDEEEIGYRIVTKLSLLEEENGNLLKMISSSNRLDLLAEVGLLRDENDALKKKLESHEDEQRE